LRKPNAMREASLTRRLFASVAALVMPVSMKARIWGSRADGAGEPGSPRHVGFWGVDNQTQGRPVRAAGWRLK
jgi:hypothetical protein